MKICSVCHTSKDDEEFSFRNKELGLRHCRCRTCQSDYTKEHYQDHKRDYIERARKSKPIYAERCRERIYDYLDGRCCIDCGEDDVIVLDFDHRDPSKKEFSIAKMVYFSWEKILREIQKCDIRCSNCHRKKTAKENGFYRYIKSINVTSSSE